MSKFSTGPLHALKPRGYRGHTVAEDKELLALANGHLAEQRQQVVRYALRIFTHDAARMSSYRVEVSQEGAVPAVAAFALFLGSVSLRLDVVGDELLHGHLCPAVRVRRTEGAFLVNGYHVREPSGVAVDRGRRREDDVGHVVAGHSSEQTNRPVDIDAVVFQRDLGRFSHCLNMSAELAKHSFKKTWVIQSILLKAWLAHLESGKVNDAVNVGMRCEDLVDGIFICHLALVEFRPFPTYQLDAVKGNGRGVVQVVDDDDLVSGLQKGQSGQGADVACASVGVVSLMPSTSS